MVRSKKLRRMFRLLSVFMVIFLIEYGDFMGIEVQAEQKPETMQIISDAFLEAYGEKYRPAQIYQYGTARYELQSLEQIKKEIPQKEQAVEEAGHFFNLCPLCERLVCNNCFLICKEIDVCRRCAEWLQETGEQVSFMDWGAP